MKVSILGAGPAGSTAAYYLAREGVDVELIDRTEFPRNKACAGGLFNPLLFYEEFPYIKEVEGMYVYKARFYCGKFSAEYNSQKPLMKTLLRKDFDYFLLQKAIAQGAKFTMNKKPEPGGDIEIVATGARIVNDYPEAGICLVNDFKTDEGIDRVHVHWGFEGIKGYCWLFPKKGYANIGVGAYLPQRNIKEIYRRYIDFLHQNNLVSIDKISFSAHITPFAPIKRFYKKNSLILGDAAGFVNTSTGEGIYFAMLSGKIAATTIIEKREFSWYEEQCRREFGEYLKPTRLHWNPSLLNKALEKAIKICSKDETFTKMVMENYFRLGKYKLGGSFLKNIFR